MFDGAGPPNLDEKIDADEGLWRLDPDKEDEDLVGMVIEEGGGGVGMLSAPLPGPSKPVVPGVPGEDLGVEAEAETELDELYAGADEKGEDYTEWDGYEQEV